MSKAEKLRRSGDITSALDIYERLCSEDPAEARWPQLAGEMCRQLKEPVQVAGFFARALGLPFAPEFVAAGARGAACGPEQAKLAFRTARELTYLRPEHLILLCVENRAELEHLLHAVLHLADPTHTPKEQRPRRLERSAKLGLTVAE